MFEVSIINVLTTLLYIIPGFLLCKCKKATADHLPTLSAILVYICGPVLVIKSLFSFDYSLEMMKNMGIFFAVTLIVQIIFMLLVYLVCRKKYDDAKYRVLTIGSVVGNVGYFGLPVITALFPNNPEVAAYSCVFSITMNILIFTIGIFCLTKDKKYISIKSAFINPTIIAFVIGLPLFIFGVKNYLPTVIIDAVNLVGGMSTPICMFILGIRLATMSFKKIFAVPFTYLIVAIKLVLFPLFAYACVYFLPIDSILKASLLILSATPNASILLSLAEIYKSQTEISANCIFLSTILCVLTIPLLVLLI